MEHNKDLEYLATIIKQKNQIDQEITRITDRPALIGHTGEFIASLIFDIRLERSANTRSIDGHFKSGSLSGKTVNIKWYSKMESLLDIVVNTQPGYYLILTGPEVKAGSSRGMSRPWVIEYVFLFDAEKLVNQINKKGTDTSVKRTYWEAAKIYPDQNNHALILSENQKDQLRLFSKNRI